MPEGGRILGLVLAPVAVVLGSALAVGGALPPMPAPAAVAAIPDEPKTVALPDDRPTIQAVAADVDGDGVREVVRLVGEARGPIHAEAWTERSGGWRQVGDPVLVVPEPAGQGERAYSGRPVRLLVRAVDGGERVTVLRQPDFADPGDTTPCCLMLDDLVADPAGLRLSEAADPSVVADAVLVIDLDGDGTDELLASRSLPPLDGDSSPSEVRIYRWDGERFPTPARTELPLGSGDVPMALGDSDGEPGDEAVLLGEGRRGLVRLSLGPDDAVVAEELGVPAHDAIAVPIESDRGLAAIVPNAGLTVLRWPRGEPVDRVAVRPLVGGLLGVVGRGDDARLIAFGDVDGSALLALRLPGLERDTDAPSRPRAALPRTAPVAGYVGPFFGGGPGGHAAVVFRGWFLAPAGGEAAAELTPMASLPGARPVGLVGADASWLAIHHATLPVPAVDPSGGRLVPPLVHPASGVTLAPADLAIGTAPPDELAYEPPVENGGELPSGELAVSDAGLAVIVRAPPGSRIYASEPGTTLLGEASVVGPSGERRVAIAAPEDDGRRVVASLTVVTPAGHGYFQSWRLRRLTGPPALVATSVTEAGSSLVSIRGTAATHATITVGGRRVDLDDDGDFVAQVTLPPWPTDVQVLARDPLGNEASVVVSGVGIFDYRALPWAAIALGLVGGAALVLLLRVPRSRPDARPAADDAVLEELDPD